ncbi:MAG: nucleotidyltransferase domain-containing protein [Methylococcaceae bacterium]|nr:nucleotidyltransferase domain-containing protein [Methylococcaceae bacterium]
MSFGLTQATVDQIQSVFAKHPEIDHVVIYGSRAKGNFRNGSDIDLTLIGQDITEQLLLLIKLELDELNTPYLFDISIFDHLNSPDLKMHIARVGQIFYKNARSLSPLE